MNPTRSFPWPLRRPDATPARPIHGLLVSVAVVVWWTLWAVALNVGQFGDNIEQFNWAQSLQWGYHKHPPLPTWILGAAIALFGPSPYWAYALSALCLVGTAVFTWLIARRLLGARLAGAALVLWSLHLSFSQRAQLYNHNTVLVLCIAATVWAALRARDSGALRWWVAVGLGGGAAMLSKYQAAVPLAGLLLALAWTGALREARARLGLALAVAVLLAVVAPHAVWVAQHDFTTLRYASEAVESSTPRQRAVFLIAFLGNQVRMFFPTLATLAICWLVARLKRSASPDGNDAPRPARDGVVPWAVGLTGFGAVVLVVLALAGGVNLRNHWGMQTFQFLCLWIAWRWDRTSRIDIGRLITIALLVQGASLTLYAAQHRDPNGVVSQRRIDTMYPARRIADAALAHWRARTSCPLNYVGGDVFIAGLVSLYSNAGHPRVYDGPVGTPWIDPGALALDGMLYVVDENDTLPPGLEPPEVFDLVLDEHVHRLPKTIRIAMRPPAQPCSP